MTQNSLPSGSASTTWPSSGRWPMSMCRAPSSTARATISCWPSRLLVRSKCIWFGPRFCSSDGKNSIRNPVSSFGSSAKPSSGSSVISQPRTPAQKLATRCGSLASKAIAASREVIPGR